MTVMKLFFNNFPRDGQSPLSHFNWHALTCPAGVRVDFVYASDMKYSCRQGKAG
jgi:hypothetical protein